MVMLEHISDAGVVQGAIRIIDKDGSLLRWKKPGYDGEKRGLSTAAGADNGDKFSVADAKGDICKGRRFSMEGVIGVADIL